jgi:hypothetical protein
VEWIWKQEGLKVPPRRPKRSRIWQSDGSCIRLRVEQPNLVWFHDFVEDRTHEGWKYRMLNVLDEFTRWSAWQTVLIGRTNPLTSSTFSQTCSTSGVCRST